MTERIDQIQYEDETPGTTLFMDGPGEFLVARIVDQILSVPQFKVIFGDSVDPYRRMDYGIRNLPALRVYNENLVKEFDSWFINGEIKLDVIFPPNIRRKETQQLPDTIASALVQQFRRPEMFVELMNIVPGLNELGKFFSVDKSLGFEWNEQLAPLTQITVNFRLDLRQWDLYLENTGRTKDSPFEVVLGDLTKLGEVIRGLRDDASTELEISNEQKL